MGFVPDEEQFSRARLDKFDLLLEEELYLQTLDEDAVHDMSVRKTMEMIDKCKYGEYNGTPVIGLWKIKALLEVDLKTLNMSSEMDLTDRYEAKSKDGNTYLFIKG